MKAKLRPAGGKDSAAMAEVYLASRRGLDEVAPLVHDDDVRAWIEEVLLETADVVTACDDDNVVAVMALAFSPDTRTL